MPANLLDTCAHGRLATRILLLKCPKLSSETRTESGGIQTSEYRSLSSSSSASLDESSSSLVDPVLASGLSGAASGASISKTPTPNEDSSLVGLSG